MADALDLGSSQTLGSLKIFDFEAIAVRLWSLKNFNFWSARCGGLKTTNNNSRLLSAKKIKLKRCADMAEWQTRWI